TPSDSFCWPWSLWGRRCTPLWSSGAGRAPPRCEARSECAAWFSSGPSTVGVRVRTLGTRQEEDRRVFRDRHRTRPLRSSERGFRGGVRAWCGPSRRGERTAGCGDRVFARGGLVHAASGCVAVGRGGGRLLVA